MLKSEGARVLAAFVAGVLLGEAIAYDWMGVAALALAFLLGAGSILLGIQLGEHPADDILPNPTSEDDKWLDN